MWAWQSSSSGAFFSLCPLTSWCLPPASGNIFIIIRGGPGLFDNIKTVLTSHLTWWRGINELNRDHEIQSEEKVEGPWMLMPMINTDTCLNYETKNLPIRRKQKGLMTNKNWRICQTVIILRRFFCSQVMVMVHAERSSWGWKVHTGMASTAWGKPLSWKIGLSDRRRAFLARACGVCSVEWNVLWMTRDDDWRTGDAAITRSGSTTQSRSRAGPAVIRAPEPSTATRAPCVYWGGPQAPALHGDYRRSKASDDSWSEISRHGLYWNPDLRDGP